MSPSHWLTDAFERDDLRGDLVQLILASSAFLVTRRCKKLTLL
jgi:hypothetical protein